MTATTIKKKKQLLKSASVVRRRTQSKLASPLQIALSARRGVAANELKTLIQTTQIETTFFAKALDITTKTFASYVQSKQLLNPNDSELVLKWKALFALGAKVFGSSQFFKQWLHTPSVAFQNEQPLSFIATSGGVDLVMGELQNIAWGDLA